VFIFVNNKGKYFESESFYSKLKEYYPNLKQPDNRFLEWFIVFSTRKARFLCNTTLEDAWLSGITEGEGCFTCSLLSK